MMHNAQPQQHIPVLCREVALHLLHNPSGTYIDGTFGRGGYSRYWLENNPNINVIGIDRDPSAQAAANQLAIDYPDRFQFKLGCFGDMANLCANENNIAKNIAGIALDLGVSSPQLDEATRGFSLRFNGPLDMRMSQNGASAADLVNTADETTLADIIWHYGEEKQSRRIAKAIVHDRVQTPFTTTRQLAEMIARVVPQKGPTHPATQTFQALRIAVNDELGELERGLQAAQNLLAPSGRLAVVTFHSLEDRVVKHFFKPPANSAPTSRHAAHWQTPESIPSAWNLLNKRPIEASPQELEHNPRARSAKLRVGIRTTNNHNHHREVLL